MNGIKNNKKISRLGDMFRTHKRFALAFLFFCVMVTVGVLAYTTTYDYTDTNPAPLSHHEEAWLNDVMMLSQARGILPMSSGVTHYIETEAELNAFLRGQPIRDVQTSNNDEFVIVGTINMTGQDSAANGGPFHGRGFVGGEPFTGILRGYDSNATIANLTLTPRTATETPDTPGHNDFGLIRVLGHGAVIKDLTFLNVNYVDSVNLATWNIVPGNIGLVAGRIASQSTVEMNNITIHGQTPGETNAAITFSGSRDTNNKMVGGLVGATDSGSILNITNVNVRLQVHLNTSQSGTGANRNIHTAGGLVGLAAGNVHIGTTGDFTNRVHFQPMLNTGNSRVFLHIGGVIGRLTSTTIGANASTIYRLHTTTAGTAVQPTLSHGGFIGDAQSVTISHSENRFGVTSATHRGGFIGISRGNIEFYFSRNYGAVSGDGTTNIGAGGFVGSMHSGSAEFYRSQNHGNVELPTLGRLGGFVGRAVGPGTIDFVHSQNHGDVRITSTTTAAGDRSRVASSGGFVGYANTSLHVTDSSNHGTVRVHGRGGSGGIAGSTASRGGTTTTLTRVTNYGEIIAVHTERFVGGFIGNSRNSITITDSTNRGIVRLSTTLSTTSNAHLVRNNAIGGFIGSATGFVTITNGRNYANIINDAQSARGGGRMRIGGFVGISENRLTITNSHNTGDITSVRYGTGGTTAHHGAGGIVGRITFRGTRANRVATLTNVSNTGIVYGTGRTGGIVGSTGHRVGAQGLTIRYAVNTGDVRSWVVGGGILGHSNSIRTTISDVVNTGNVRVNNRGTGASTRGGLISGGGIVGRSSRNDLQIIRAGNDASVTAVHEHTGSGDTLNTGGGFSTGSGGRGANGINNTNTAGAGGIVGNIQRGTRNQITLSYNAGAVRGHMHGVGGVVGSIRRRGTTLIQDVYNVGLVHSTNIGVASGPPAASPAGHGILGFRRNIVGTVTLNRVFNASNVTGHPIFRGTGGGGAGFSGASQTRNLTLAALQRRMIYRDVFFDTSIHNGHPTAGFIAPTVQGVPTSILTSGGLAAFRGDDWRIRGWLDHFDPDVPVEETWETYPFLAWQTNGEEPRAFFQLIEPGADHTTIGPSPQTAHFWLVHGYGWTPPPETYDDYFTFLDRRLHDRIRTFNQYASRPGTHVAHPYRPYGNTMLDNIIRGQNQRMSIGLISPRGVVAFNGNELFDGLIIVGIDGPIWDNGNGEIEVVTWSRMQGLNPDYPITNPPFTFYAGMLNLSASEAERWQGLGCGPNCLALGGPGPCIPNGSNGGHAHDHSHVHDHSQEHEYSHEHEYSGELSYFYGYDYLDELSYFYDYNYSGEVSYFGSYDYAGEISYFGGYDYAGELSYFSGYDYSGGYNYSADNGIVGFRSYSVGNSYIGDDIYVYDIGYSSDYNYSYYNNYSNDYSQPGHYHYVGNYNYSNDYNHSTSYAYPSGNYLFPGARNEGGGQIRISALGYHNAYTCITIDQVSAVGDGRVLVLVPMDRAPIEHLVLALHDDSAYISENDDIQPRIPTGRYPVATSSRSTINSVSRPTGPFTPNIMGAPLGIPYILPIPVGRSQAAPRHSDLPIYAHFNISGSYWHDILTGQANGFTTETLTLIHSAIENPYNHYPTAANPLIVRIGMRDIDLPDMPMRIVRVFEHVDEELDEGDLYLAIPHGGRIAGAVAANPFASGTVATNGTARFTVELRNPDGMSHSSGREPLIISGAGVFGAVTATTTAMQNVSIARAPLDRAEINTSTGTGAAHQSSSVHWWLYNITEYTEIRVVPYMNREILSPATGSGYGVVDGDITGNGGNITRSFRPSEWIPLGDIIEWSDDDDESEADHQDPLRITVPIEYETTRRVAVVEYHVYIEGYEWDVRIPITYSSLDVLADVGIDTLQARPQVMNPINSGIFNPVRFIDGEEAEARAPGWSTEREVLSELQPGDTETIYIELTRNPLARIYVFVMNESMLTTPEDLNYINGATVHVICRESNNIIATTQSAAITPTRGGFFEVFLPENTFPGSYLVMATHPTYGFGTSIPSPVNIPAEGDNARVNIFLGNAGYFPIFVRTIDRAGNNISYDCTAVLTYGLPSSPRTSVYDGPYQLIMVRAADRNVVGGWINGNVVVSDGGAIPIGEVNIQQYLTAFPERNPNPDILIIITIRTGVPDWWRLNNAINAITNPPDRIVIHPRGTTGVEEIVEAGGVRTFNLIITDDGDENTITTVPITMPTTDPANTHRIRVPRSVSVEAAPGATINLLMPVAGFPNTPSTPPWNATPTENLGRHFIVTTTAGNFTLGGVGSGTLILDGNAFYGGITRPGNRGGVQVDGGAGLTMHIGSAISNSRALDGGGVHVSGLNSTFVMTGGIVGHQTNRAQGNTAIVSGGGVWVGGGARFDMQDYNAETPGTGRIMNNTSMSDIGRDVLESDRLGGGGVFVTAGSGTGDEFVPSLLRLYTGIIEDNHADRGGGVMARDGARINMYAGTHIRGNSAYTITGDSSDGSAGGGGGVLVVGGYSATLHPSTFTMAGGQISRNTSAASGGINGGAGVHLSVAGGARPVFNMAGGIIGGTSALDRNYFVQSLNVPSTMFSGTGAGIFARGGVINMGGNARVSFNDTINTNSGGGIQLLGESRLNLGGNAEITNNGAGTGGGGINVAGGSIVYMSGGVIAHNYVNAGMGGGGVHVGGTASVFNMSGGVIRDHSTPRGTGGIGQNPIIANGAGVRLAAGTFNLSGDAEIRNNSAGRIGGGILVEGGTLNIRGGYIHSNHATGAPPNAQGTHGYGGGIHIASPGVVNFYSGTIGGPRSPLGDAGNSAVYGGGVWVGVGATFNIRDEGAKYITGNDAVRDGAGVFLAWANATSFGQMRMRPANPAADPPIVLATNLNITNNAAARNGGGIFTQHHDNHPNPLTPAPTNPPGVASNLFQNITLQPATVFSGNSANTLARPPVNVLAPYDPFITLPNMRWAQTSPASPLQGSFHPLNNYDINFVNHDVPLIFTKVDEVGNVRLAGAVFHLYRRGEWCTVELEWIWDNVATATSSSLPPVGEVRFNLTFDGIYKMREVSPPTRPNRPNVVFTLPQGYWTIPIDQGVVQTPVRSNTNMPNFTMGIPVTGLSLPLDGSHGHYGVAPYQHGYYGVAPYQVGNDDRHINEAPTPTDSGFAPRNAVLMLPNVRYAQFDFLKTTEAIYASTFPSPVPLLQGAQFMVFRAPAASITDATRFVINSTIAPNGPWVPIPNTSVINMTSSNNANNPVSFRMNPLYVYQLVETVAPTGFGIPGGQWRLTVTGGVIGTPQIITDGAFPTPHFINVPCTCADAGTEYCTRPTSWLLGNFPERDFELPLAGGRGTLVYTTSGVMFIFIAGVVVYFIKIRRGKFAYAGCVAGGLPDKIANDGKIRFNKIRKSFMRK